MMELEQQLKKLRVVPTLVVDAAEKAVPAARALAKGGLPCAEITFRTAAAEESIRRIAGEVPDVLLGAGTVLTIEQADRAIAAGARFVVSPGFNPRVVGHCVERGIPIIPGCATPSEMEQAIEQGLALIKFFPAEAMGGLAFLRAVSAPYSMLRFLPTGGIDATNYLDYLAFDKVVACGGSWMVPRAALASGDFDAITRNCAALTL